MARKVIAEFDAIDGPFINKLRAIDASVSRFEVGTIGAFGRVEKGMNGLLASASRLQAVSGIIAGGFGANIATTYIDQATRIRRALKEAGDETEAGFQKAFLASQRSLSGFEAFSQGAQRMKKATGGTFDNSIRDMETLNKLLVLGGKSTQERMSTMIQFSQALQANVLQGEELRSLRENAPIELVRAIAFEGGGTIEDLKDLGAEGKLTADVMIRALKSLESEADLRMKSVTLTISEAATVLANAGIVAVEAFDKGLGLSRTTVAGLTGLAGILGENAEAAEMFGKAVQVAGGLMLASFAGRNINAAVANTRAYGESLRTAAAAATAAEGVAATSVVNAGMREAAIKREIAALRLKEGTQRQVANAYKRLEAAQISTAAAATRYRAAVDAAAAATARLAPTARAAAAAGRLLQGAWAFLGGWPGLILTAGLAFMTLRGQVESAAERFDRLTSGTGSAEAAAESMRDVQSRLNEAIAAAGTASDEASRKIVANTLEELRHKQNLLKVETRRAEMAQDERRQEVSSLQGEVAGIYRNADGLARVERSTFGETADVSQIMADADAAAAPLRDKIIELEAALFDAGERIRENNVLLLDSASTAADLRDGLSGAAEEQVRLTEEAATEYAKLLRSKQDEAALAQLIRQFGEESRVVAEARAFAERLAYEELLKSKEITGPFAEELMAAYDAAAALADTDMASGVAAAGAEAKSLAEWLEAALGRAAAIARQAAAAQQQLDQMRFEFSPGGQALGKYGGRGGSGATREITDGRGFVLKDGKFVDPNAKTGRGGGGGGGRQKENELDREALSLIESMMTAEERRAEKIKEAVNLREQLVQKYGVEHEMVQRVDEAIVRMNQNLEESKSLAEQFWGTMSDAIAGSIQEWKGWGDFARNILSSLVREYGEDFFVALLSPGKQSGGGLGTFLGNALTGQLHSGGSKSDRQARNVPAAAFVGAPRFHKGLLGLKSDEFTAILQEGETVLPKGVGLGGGDRVSVVNHNDFRGVDSTSRAFVEAQLRRLEQSIPAKAVQAVQSAKRQRVLR